MPQLKELLIDELQDLLNAENQIVGALPKMVDAAHCPKLKNAFEKHRTQTETHVERLKLALQSLGEEAESKPCKAMVGILEEGEETIKEGQGRDEVAADLALIGAAQKVEHYEITSYGTARCLAKQLGERKVAKLLSYTLGEEEAADFLLTGLSDPLMQRALAAEFGDRSKAPWGEPGDVQNKVETDVEEKPRARAAAADSKSSRSKA